MYIICIVLILIKIVSSQYYTYQSPAYRNYQTQQFINQQNQPYYDTYDTRYDPYYEAKPLPSSQIPQTTNPSKQPQQTNGLKEILSIIFSCVAMICVMFNKRPVIKRLIKTRSSSFINEVSLLSEVARQVGIISLGLVRGGQFHTIGEVTIGLLLNMFILLVCVIYSQGSKRQTFLASFIGVSMFAFSFASKSLNHNVVEAMPYLGSAISFRLSMIPKLIRTRQIVGTTTYRALYLGATSLICRILSFLTVNRMYAGRWLFIGLPLVSILVLIFVHWQYDVKEQQSKQKHQQQHAKSKQVSQVSFHKKTK